MTPILFIVVIVVIAVITFTAVWLFQSRQETKPSIKNVGGLDLGRTADHNPVDETQYTKVTPIETELTDVNRSVYRKGTVKKLHPNDLLELNFKHSIYERESPSKLGIKNLHLIQVFTGFLDIGNINRKLEPELSSQMDGGYIIQPTVKSIVCENDKYSVTILINRWKPNEPAGDAFRLKYSVPPAIVEYVQD